MIGDSGAEASPEPNFPNDFNFRVLTYLPSGLFSTILLPFARNTRADVPDENVFRFSSGPARFNRYTKLVSFASAKYLIFLVSPLQLAFLFMFSPCNRTALSTREKRPGGGCIRRKLAARSRHILSSFPLTVLTSKSRTVEACF